MDFQSKWNNKHRERMKQLTEPASNPRLMRLASYLNGGNALDFACGLGGNSLFLSRKGYNVQAIDISDVAIDYIKDLALKNNLSIDARMADLTSLDQHSWDNQSFDMIVVTYYLDRRVFPLIKKILKAGGYFFMETYYQAPTTAKQGVSDQYKLKPKELLNEFGDWQVLYYEENEHERRQTIFCRKC
ncbi:methyltransferase domain-containing protein [Neobacillus cucumis]|uniref:class I SAM-dependent methyltransferase n=1 Tax=Neobacillus cucumis TaxID=1740721 RepID=UPI00204187B8|nr:methyltransferase domain-containing protein [Neobacillus cucumis]MCM3728843.1 methyltransferase domain-containing protein [Neobacillus cucumis]